VSRFFSNPAIHDRIEKTNWCGEMLDLARVAHKNKRMSETPGSLSLELPALRDRLLEVCVREVQAARPETGKALTASA
jgi:hypothetical protein